MRTLNTVLAVSALLAGCQRDPGRDVKPMTATVPTNTVRTDSTPLSAIIPLDQVAKSQAAIVGQRIANTELTLTYSRPVARGRVLFGGIVPYDQVWTPGADRATAITVTRDVTIDGHPLGAGKYSVWAIPRRDHWTVIFSQAADVYHTEYPGEARDALRFDVAPVDAPYSEVLTFEFSRVEGKDAELRLRWGTVAIPLPIRVP